MTQKSASKPMVAHAPVPVYTGAAVGTPSHSEAPIASNFPANPQHKLQATQHWMRIADDAAQSLAGLFKSTKVCKGGVDKCPLVVVREARVQTEFGRVFRNQVITRLVRLGVPVSKDNKGDAKSEMSVDFDVQPIQFSANRPQYRHAGTPEDLGEGVWALRDVMTTEPSSDEAPAKADALHWFRSEFAAGQTPRTELFITVSVSDKRRFLARTANAYYISDADKRLYDAELCSLFRVCGGASDKKSVITEEAKPEKVLPKTKTLELVGDCAVPGPSCPDARKARAPRRTVAPAGGSVVAPAVISGSPAMPTALPAVPAAPANVPALVPTAPAGATVGS
jgi:hypothetical protein